MRDSWHASINGIDLHKIIDIRKLSRRFECYFLNETRLKPTPLKSIMNKKGEIQLLNVSYPKIRLRPSNRYSTNDYFVQKLLIEITHLSFLSEVEILFQIITNQSQPWSDEI